MFDTFTRQLYRAGGRDDLADALSVVPRATLQKLAFGELECGEGHKTWLEKFKGTALFDKALELMQAELEQEAQEMQNRQQSQQFYSAGDQIRLKKKLLELELARTEMGQLTEPGPIEQEAPSATAPAQGAATQASITPEPGAPPKTASVENLAELRFLAALENMGKEAGIGEVLGNIFKRKGSSLAHAVEAVPKTVRDVPRTVIPHGPPMSGMPIRHPHYPSPAATLHDAPPPTLRMSAAEQAGFGGVPPTVRMEGVPPTVRMPPSSMEKRQSAAPIALLREMAKQSGIGQAALGFIKKNPGLAAGAVGGMAIGGVRGAQQNIDPATGQPVGGGITGAVGGALTGGVAGGALGLGAQGAIRSGLGAHKATQAWGKKGLTAPGGGFTSQFVQQAGARAHGFTKDLQQLHGAVGTGLQSAADAQRAGVVDYSKAVRAAMPPTAVPPAAAKAAAGV